MHVAVDATYQSVTESPGGGATFLIEVIPRLERELSMAGSRLTVFCSRTDKPYYRNLGLHTVAFRTEPAPLRGMATHLWVPLMSKALRVDVLLQPGNFASILKTNKQVVIAQSLLTFLHFPNELGWTKATYRRFMVWLTTHRADAMVFLSEAQQEEFRTYYKQLRYHQVIYPGAPRVQGRAENRKKWILVVTSLWHYKNVQGVLDIASRLRDRHIVLPVIIVGDGPMFDQLTDQINRRGLGDTVVLAGAKPLEEVFKLYEDAALTLNLSMAESFGFPVLESMAFGVPVIISNQRALKEVAGDAGVIMENSDSAVAWIEKWTQSDEDWRRARSLALSRAEAFSWDQTVRNIVALCQSVAPNKSI